MRPVTGHLPGDRPVRVVTVVSAALAVAAVGLFLLFASILAGFVTYLVTK